MFCFTKRSFVVSLFLTKEKIVRAFHYYWYCWYIATTYEFDYWAPLFGMVIFGNNNEENIKSIVCVEKRVDTIIPSCVWNSEIPAHCEWPGNSRDQTNVTIVKSVLYKKKIEKRKEKQFIEKRGCKQIEKNLVHQMPPLNRNATRLLVVSDYYATHILKHTKFFLYNSWETKQFMHIELDLNFFRLIFVCVVIVLVGTTMLFSLSSSSLIRGRACNEHKT